MSPEPMSRRRASWVALAAWLLGALSVGRSSAATRIDPRLTFRTVRTAHFTIYFHDGEQDLADRLAAFAEDVWTSTPRRLGLTPPAQTHVVLADQADRANGWAFPLPVNTILLHAAVPAGYERIGRATDWLRVLFTHEFTHIVHLDRSEGWARGARRIFGRSALALPNLFLPEWMTEGLAVYEESAATGEGRQGAGDFRSIETEAARAGRFPSLDRVNGGLVAWPSGEAAYAFGLGFHEFLAERAGSASLGAVARRTAGRVPFLASRSFADVYGDPLGVLWGQYQQRLASRAAAPVTEGARRLTTSGFATAGPRFLPPDCAGCQSDIVYSTQTPDAFPSLDAVALDGSAHRRLATRYGGRTSGVAGAWLAFDQLDVRRNAGLYSDLHLLHRPTGRLQTLSLEGRYADPDLAPDAHGIVCVREHDGRRDLVVLPLLSDGSAGRSDTPPRVRAGPVRIVASETGTAYSAPRWSPDGRRIAVERHRRGRWPELVVVDADSGRVEMVAAVSGSRVVTPAWRPDGAAVVAAVAVAQGTFDLWEFPVGGGLARRLTALPGGALWPDVSPDASQIVFIGSGGDGFDVYVTPYAPMTETLAVDRDDAAGSVTAAAEAVRGAPYRPWTTLRPTSWMPTIEDNGRRTRIGAMVSGTDVLAYHRYDGLVGWVASAPAGAAASGSTPDWRFDYAYERWRPSWFASVSSEQRYVTRAGMVETRRRREIGAGVLVPVLGVRASQYVGGAVAYAREGDEGDAEFARPQSTRTTARGGWARSTAHQYGYSVSPEEGTRIGVVAQTVVSGLERLHTNSLAAELRRYARGLARHHVIAMRLAGGTAFGGRNPDEWFLLGGSGPVADVATLEPRPFGLLRAFAVDRFAGPHMAVANVDYRWPIAWLERGDGTWPIFIRGIHGAVFADTGHAWSGRFRPAEAKTSAGVELGASIVLGYSLPLTVSVGAGLGRDGARAGQAPERAAYVRVGTAF